MISELSFLIELLLEHDLKPETKKALQLRIKDVEAGLRDWSISKVNTGNAIMGGAHTPVAHLCGTKPAGQAASTLAAFARHGLNPEAPIVPPPPAPEPVAVIAQTPAAQAAMASRNQAINESIAGKVNKDTGRPRKF